MITANNLEVDGVVEVVVMGSQFTTTLARQDSRILTQRETKITADTNLNTLSTDQHVIYQLGANVAEPEGVKTYKVRDIEHILLGTSNKHSSIERLPIKQFQPEARSHKKIARVTRITDI
jgi:hypothetical protein